MNVETIGSKAIPSQPVAVAPLREPQREPQHQPKPVEGKAVDRPSQQPEVDPEELATALEGVNSFLAAAGNHIQFAMHEGSGQMMVEVIDDTTNEVIKTFPSKELLDLAGKIGELVGTLLDQKG